MMEEDSFQPLRIRLLLRLLLDSVVIDHRRVYPDWMLSLQKDYSEKGDWLRSTINTSLSGDLKIASFHIFIFFCFPHYINYFHGQDMCSGHSRGRIRRGDSHNLNRSILRCTWIQTVIEGHSSSIQTIIPLLLHFFQESGVSIDWVLLDLPHAECVSSPFKPPSTSTLSVNVAFRKGERPMLNINYSLK